MHVLVWAVQPISVISRVRTTVKSWAMPPYGRDGCGARAPPVTGLGAAAQSRSSPSATPNFSTSRRATSACPLGSNPDAG